MAATQKSATGMKTAKSSMTVRSGSIPPSDPRPMTKKNTVTPREPDDREDERDGFGADRPVAETRRL